MSDFVFDRGIICPQDPTATEQRIKEYEKYYAIKYDICKEINPSRIAEIGVRAGYSAWAFLQACPTAEYYGLDANNGTHGGQGGQDGKFAKWAKKLLENYDTKFIDIDTQKASSLDLRNIDLFHIDGDHTSKGVMHDLDLAIESISDKGFILVDDITFLDSVKSGVEEWLKRNKDRVNYEYRESLRGECLIEKK